MEFSYCPGEGHFPPRKCKESWDILFSAVPIFSDKGSEILEEAGDKGSRVSLPFPGILLGSGVGTRMGMEVAYAHQQGVWVCPQLPPDILSKLKNLLPGIPSPF